MQAESFHCRSCGPSIRCERIALLCLRRLGALARRMMLPMGEALKEERRRAVLHYKGMDIGGGIQGWRSKL